MDTPDKTFQRLVAALEQLVAEEHCVVRTGEFQKIRAVQLRADSIITRLVELHNDPEVTSQDTKPLLQRLAAVQGRRAATIEIMDARLAAMRATLAALDAGRSRLGNMRNAYGSRRRINRPAVPRLSLSA
jgi:hypothetical protein